MTSKKYQLDEKEAEDTLKDILTASGQDAAEGGRHFRRIFHQKKSKHRMLLFLALAVLTAALASIFLSVSNTTL